MKKTGISLLITVCLTVLFCQCTSKEQRAYNEVFTASEQENIDAIISYYDQYVFALLEENVGAEKLSIDSCYRLFSEYLMKENLMAIVPKYRSMFYSTMDEDFLNDMYVINRDENGRIMSYKMNTKSKYAVYIKKIAATDKSKEKYASFFNQEEFQAPQFYEYLIKEMYPLLDFNKKTDRMLFIIPVMGI